MVVLRDGWMARGLVAGLIAAGLRGHREVLDDS